MNMDVKNTLKYIVNALEFFPMAFPTLYDYCLEVETKSWEAWEWLVPEYLHDREARFSSILVPTVDTLRLTWLIQIMESVSYLK